MLTAAISYDISLEQLCKAHLEELAPALREKDKQELEACYQLPVREGLQLCAARSVCAVAFRYRGEVCAVAGLEPSSLLGAQACVWSWTGIGVEKCPKSFWRVSKRVIDFFKHYYPHLYAACDVRYEQAAHYLCHLGARPAGKLFYLAAPEIPFALYQWQ